MSKEDIETYILQLQAMIESAESVGNIDAARTARLALYMFTQLIGRE